MKMGNWLFIGVIVAIGFILQGCMLMHLVDDHHSGMMGHGAKNHEHDKGRGQPVSEHRPIVLPDDQPRKDIQGGVAVEIQFDEVTDKGELAFRVKMTDHSSSLEFYKLEQTSSLINNHGAEVSASRWRPTSPDRQHVIGKIYFPVKDPAGKPLLGHGAGKLALKIKDLGGIPERVFEWKVGSEK